MRLALTLCRVRMDEESGQVDREVLDTTRTVRVARSIEHRATCLENGSCGNAYWCADEDRASLVGARYIVVTCSERFSVGADRGGT